MLCENSFFFYLLPPHFITVLYHYLTDKFGSLGSLLYVRTINYTCVVQVGFGILLVGNLWYRAEEQTEYSIR